MKDYMLSNAACIPEADTVRAQLIAAVHTAAASGRWCGAERPLCGLSNSRH